MVDFTSDLAGNVPRLAPVTFEYIGDAAPAVVGYAWSFGDGATSNEARPTHHWTTLGAKNVGLFVTRVDGTNETITKTAYVTITVDALDDYRNLLFEYFRPRQSIRDLLTPHLEQATILDHAVGRLSTIRALTNYGEVLDLVGEILFLPRLGRDDDTYRAALGQMVYVCRGYGQLEVVIAYTQLFMLVDHLHVFSGNMCIMLSMIGTPPVSPALFLTRVRQLVAAGVDISVVVGAGIPFEFGSVAEPPTHDVGSELSEIGYYDGGELAELYT
jgi:PKD repeat protein